MTYDAVIVGGSFAGLAAATMLARARRRVLVVDAGSPRNRFASHSHGLIGQDGRPGQDILRDARAQLAAYPTCELQTGEALSAAGEEGRFEVRLVDGGAVSAKRLLLATGVADDLPDLPGLHERWGATVLHCPYCHGYEIGGGPIGVLATNAMAVHKATLVADWGDVTLFTNGEITPDAASRAMLANRGVLIEETPVAGLEGEAPQLSGIRLTDGRLAPIRALFVAAPVRMTSPLAEQLGCAFDETPVGTLIRTDESKQTSIPGVYAAGDAANPRAAITVAAADGVVAGASLHMGLVMAEAGGTAAR
ncbi:NAD(P)/FAD-dependent oxidoreductase [Pedomonas mirosovicensis]|uniref:NAD(P)/FAD-dependent oxidoreductase n=1 Tax=Pedomonas mirosovicensis TaxID=2908641 RepID=UPI00216A78E7|nr:NAD(P)/FAD-dependent oxidoreductase [Pedomonas mirosovicensis]MCH8686750.1 NAD(P)/FAD-dependent oxidoreductase [Pedomonas mirosovicensis]